MDNAIIIVLAVLLAFFTGVFYRLFQRKSCDHSWLKGFFTSLDKQVFVICKKCAQMKNVTHLLDDDDDSLPVVARKDNVIHVDFTGEKS